MSRILRALVCALGMAVAVAPVRTLDRGLMSDPGPQAQVQRPVFRSDAHFVTVDAYPLRDGKVVENLAVGDFVVREDGVVQQVELFEFVGGAAPQPETSRRDPNTVAESREAAADPRARAFVTYLDIPHVSIAGAHRSRAPLVELLNRLITANDVFSVISSEHDVATMTFARRVTAIEDQLARYWAWGFRDSYVRTPDEDGLWSCFAYEDPPSNKERFVADGARERALPTVLIERQREDRLITHLEDLVWYLGRLREGRTSVLLFSEGWRLFQSDRVLKAEVERTGNVMPQAGTRGGQIEMFTTVAQGQRQACIMEGVRLAQLDLGARHRELIRLANSMNVSFFAVNPLGLVASDSNPAERSSWGATDDASRISARRDALMTLSTETDGVAAISTNDLRAGLRPVLDQLRSFYLLGYYSTNKQFDGGTRHISVTSVVPGVDVKARRSYRAPTAEERAMRANPIAAPGLNELDIALDVLAGIRSADDRTFNATGYLRADAAPLLGMPAVFRATPSPRSPIVPVTAPAFRRNERLRVEWPVTRPLESRVARVVGRDGKPLAVQVAVSERAGEPAVFVVDALLSPLAPGDYAVEVTVTGGGETRRTFIAFKVVP